MHQTFCKGTCRETCNPDQPPRDGLSEVPPERAEDAGGGAVSAPAPFASYGWHDPAAGGESGPLPQRGVVFVVVRAADAEPPGRPPALTAPKERGAAHPDEELLLPQLQAFFRYVGHEFDSAAMLALPPARRISWRTS